MATKKKSTAKEASEPLDERISFAVEPGTKVKISLEVGEEIRDGKVPLTLHIEQVCLQPDAPVEVVVPAPQPISISKPVAQWVALEQVQHFVKKYDLAAWLFVGAIVIYLATRLIGLTQFPIYFFTDEAVQSQSILDLVNNGYRDPSGVLFPTYFRNGDYYNIGVSVYLQWLPALLFGKSAVATRVTSVLVTLLAAMAIGLILREIFKLKYWWAGTLFLSITPAWFLHSRTAFETAEFVAFYAGALGAYLFYRYKSPRYLYLALVLGSLSFYTYSPGQVIVPLTALGLLLSDWRYHWENRRTVLIGLAMGLIFAIPYLRATLNNPNAAASHLHDLYSYIFEDISFSEKIVRYISEFGIGLSPWYWYVPNDRDLSRHLMKDYGNILIATLPLALFGLVHALRNFRMPAYRAILISLLTSPAAAALVQVSITRTLVFVVPAAILTAIGLEQVLSWIEDPHGRLLELSDAPAVTPRRAIIGLVILLLGIFAASFVKEGINGVTLWTLTLLLALQVLGILGRLARNLLHRNDSAPLNLWRVSPALVSLPLFIALAGTNVHMLNDSLKNGPLWFRDYGMGGMQYGAFQIFSIIEKYMGQHPEAQIIFSPDWANGTDLVARYMLNDPSSIQIGSALGHITQKLPLDKNTVFIMTPQEYDQIKESPKFTDIQVESIVPYPDGSPGFYFVHLRYVDNIDQIFAAEKAVRQALREATLRIDGQKVKVRFSYLDAAEFQDQWMALAFDNDPFTVTKTLESNPFVIEMTFPEPRSLSGFSIIIGTAQVQITLKCYSTLNAEPITYTFKGEGTKEQPELSFDLPEVTQANALRFDVLVPSAPDNSKVHIWELKLR